MEPETDFLEDDNAPRGQPRRVWSDASVLAGMGDRVEQFKAHLKDSKGPSTRVHPARLPVISHSPSTLVSRPTLTAILVVAQAT